MMYGLKLTGEDFFLPTLLDISVNFALKPPSYYDDPNISTAPPSGYMLLMDTQMIFPYISSEHTLVYFGFGPYINYSSFKIALPGDTKVLKMDTGKLGAVATGGIAFRFGTLVLKLEGRYHYDDNAYYGAVFGIQFSR